MAAVAAQAPPSETPLWINGPSGELFGILHRPAGARGPSICVIMLNSGMQNRSGSERLYVNVARRFAESGITVLRVDLAGCGDSMADNRQTHFDSHRPEEVDAIVGYAIDALRPDAIVLQGLCAGSRVALKAAARNSAVDGVLAWSTTIYTAPRNMPQSPDEPEDRLSKPVVIENRKRLLRFVLQLKWLNPVWWARRLVGERSLRRDAVDICRSLGKSIRSRGSPRGKAPFLQAADSYLLDERRVLFVYGDRDRMSLKEFLTRFPGVAADRGDQSYAVIPNAGHTFSSRSAQLVVARISLEWIQHHFSDVSRRTHAAPELTAHARSWYPTVFEAITQQIGNQSATARETLRDAS